MWNLPGKFTCMCPQSSLALINPDVFLAPVIIGPIGNEEKYEVMRLYKGL